MQDIMLTVELCGGPMDGHREDVSKAQLDRAEVHLFGQNRVLTVAMDVQLKAIMVTYSVERIRCAYMWANRTTGKGRRWVLQFSCVVSRWVNHEQRTINLSDPTTGES